MSKAKGISRLREQLNRIAILPFYTKRFQKMGLKPEDLGSLEDFQNIPLMDIEDLQEDLEKDPPYGSLFHPETVRITLSPGPKGFMPVYHTRKDIEETNQELAALYRACGVDIGDIAAITFGYHLFIAGTTLHGGFEALGCKTIPVGPGESQRTAEILNRFKATILASNPSFAQKLAQEGVKSIRLLIAGGEPFSSVEG